VDGVCTLEGASAPAGGFLPPGRFRRADRVRFGGSDGTAADARIPGGQTGHLGLPDPARGFRSSLLDFVQESSEPAHTRLGNAKRCSRFLDRGETASDMNHKPYSSQTHSNSFQGACQIRPYPPNCAVRCGCRPAWYAQRPGSSSAAGRSLIAPGRQLPASRSPNGDRGPVFQGLSHSRLCSETAHENRSASFRWKPGSRSSADNSSSAR
jgi:hypothetical protein